MKQTVVVHFSARHRSRGVETVPFGNGMYASPAEFPPEQGEGRSVS
jgi:hypothetical protein